MIDTFCSDDAVRRLRPRWRDADFIHLVDLRAALESMVPQLAGSVFDYGCGAMPYQELFARPDLRYAGGDFPANRLASIALRENGSVPAEDASFDAVFSCQVLEHVPDPRQYLRESRRLLRAGGKLLLTTHGVWEYHPVPTDRHRWTHEGLDALLGEEGFEVVVGAAVTGGLRASAQLAQLAIRDRTTWPWVVRGALRLAVNVASSRPTREQLAPWNTVKLPLVLCALAVKAL